MFEHTWSNAFSYNPRLDPAFTFVRFRSHTSDIELEVDPAGTSVAAEAASPSQSDNIGQTPFYNKLPVPSSFKSTFLAPFSHASISSIRSVLSGSGSSNTSLATNTSRGSSLFPITALHGGVESSSLGGSGGGLTENFDNPIFRMFHSQELAQQQASSSVTSPTTTTITTSSSQKSLNSNEWTLLTQPKVWVLNLIW